MLPLKLPAGCCTYLITVCIIKSALQEFYSGSLKTSSECIIGIGPSGNLVADKGTLQQLGRPTAAAAACVWYSVCIALWRHPHCLHPTLVQLLLLPASGTQCAVRCGDTQTGCTLPWHCLVEHLQDRRLQSSHSSLSPTVGLCDPCQHAAHAAHHQQGPGIQVRRHAGTSCCCQHGDAAQLEARTAPTYATGRRGRRGRQQAASTGNPTHTHQRNEQCLSVISSFSRLACSICPAVRRRTRR